MRIGSPFQTYRMSHNRGSPPPNLAVHPLAAPPTSFTHPTQCFATQSRPPFLISPTSIPPISTACLLKDKNAINNITNSNVNDHDIDNDISNINIHNTNNNIINYSNINNIYVNNNVNSKKININKNNIVNCSNNINDDNNNNANTYLDLSMLVISGLLLWETFYKFISHFRGFHYDCLIYSLYAYRATLFVLWNYNHYKQYTAAYVVGTTKSM